MRYRILALLLAGAMLFTLAACGGNPGGAEASDQPTESAPESTAPAESEAPSVSPSDEPPESPSEEPSESPSASPSEEPSESPSAKPSESPSAKPSEKPSESPSPKPSESPSAKPSATPSPKPSEKPSESPTPSAEPPASPEPSEPANEAGGGGGYIPALPSLPPSPTPSAPASTADLQSFYEGLFDKYENFNASMAVEGDFLTNYYPGLSDIGTKQRVIYQPMISAVVCEIALVEVENAADVQAVKEIFQARIDAQVGTDDAPGGAWYPESIEGWKTGSRIVSKGNCVMMIAFPDGADQVVADFNGQF